MFTALFNIFKAETHNNIDLDQANKALRERMNHVLHHPYNAPRAVPRETYSTALLKNRVSRRTIVIV
jgi:hypothetical protein